MKAINKTVEPILVNMAIGTLGRYNIGKAFKVFKALTFNLSLSQKKKVFAHAIALHRKIENKSLVIKKEREEFNRLLEQARAMV